MDSIIYPGKPQLLTPTPAPRPQTVAVAPRFQPDPSFSGSMTFVFDQELDEDMEDGSWDGVPRDKPELELSVTVEKVKNFCYFYFFCYFSSILLLFFGKQGAPPEWAHKT